MEQRIDLSHPVTVCKASAGTGKTFTLAAYYIGLLMSDEDYRSILAITFTNKATAEMSERILANLNAIWHGKADANLIEAVQSFMWKEENKNEAYMQRRAGECFRAMLADFDNVKIQTIDSFLQTLLSGLAGMLHQSAGNSTELDVKHVIEQATDQILTTDLTDENRRLIERFTHYKISQATSWDIRKNLRELAQILYNEQAQQLDSAGRIDFDAASIARRRALIERRWKEDKGVMRIEALLEQLEHYDLSMTNGKSVVSAMKNIRTSMDNPKAIKKEDRFRGLTQTQMDTIASGGWKPVPQEVKDMIVEATELIRQRKSLYYTVQLTIALSHEMELMSSLQHIIRRNLSEANSALLSRTASVLSDALKAGDADFILEKAGIRYRHVLMDEFQDTSRLQWTVIEKMLQDLLAGEGHTLLIVGDIKQAIYRWRNGDWKIMEGLGGTGYGLRMNRKFTSLKKNFRSSEEVVKFNLSLFQYLMDNYRTEVQDDAEEAALAQRIYEEGFAKGKLADYYQADKKQGGYVQFRAFPRNLVGEGKEQMVMDMFDTMEQLLERGAQPTDMMVLARFGADAKVVTDMHQQLDPAQYPRLSQTTMVSESGFLLEASTAVKCVIAGLQVVWQDDALAADYIRMMTGKEDVAALIATRVNKRTPLYEAVSELIRLLLTDETGQYTGTETAYLTNFLDRTRDYVSAYGSKVEDFLEYWEDTLREKAISAATNGIRIMTVHKSKGLQAQTLFVPFCTWSMDECKESQTVWCPVAPELKAGEDYVPIYAAQEMGISAYREAYEEEHRSARIDSLNMLYVALTRAEDNLFIYSDYQVDDAGNPKRMTHVGQYIMDYVGGDDFSEGEIVVKGERLKVKGEREEVETAELWANSDQVRFIQSQEGALYTQLGDEAYRRMARMEEGTLCHEIFSRIHTKEELEPVLDEFESRGEISGKEQRDELRTLISSAWEGNDEVRSWFVDPWELKLEEAILIGNKEIRPDRVMIDRNTNEAIVLDYKFGQWNEKYIAQVQEYMDALRAIGHPHVRGYLWFARNNKLVKVKGER